MIILVFNILIATLLFTDKPQASAHISFQPFDEQWTKKILLDRPERDNIKEANVAVSIRRRSSVPSKQSDYVSPHCDHMQYFLEGKDRGICQRG